MAFNYFENVPVKISEKYKPLPKLYTVPQHVAARLSLPSNYYEESTHYNYDFQLEKKVTEKMDEWTKIRQMERESRRERKEKREHQVLREIESKNKQLLTAVSYPSAEDLSSESDNDKETKSLYYSFQANDSTIASGSSSCSIVNYSTTSYSFDTILQPTVLDNTSTVPVSLNSSLYNSSINYSEFENDTSSPFDNVELKTMNDLDILAQVLHNTNVLKINSNTSSLYQNSARNNTKLDENVYSHQIPNKDNGYSLTLETDIPDRTTLVQEKNNFLTLDFNDCNKLHFSSHSQSQPQQCIDTLSCDKLSNTTTENQQVCMNNINKRRIDKNNLLAKIYYNPLPNNCAYLNNGRGILYQQENTYLTNEDMLHPSFPYKNKLANSCDQQIITKETSLPLGPAKNKSNSVPNILKELGDEIHYSENRKIRNFSQTLENVAEKRKPKKSYYTALPNTAKQLAKNISSMGFPLEQVAKVAQRVGDDDKKIVEHLINLNELRDLGFDESKIFEALMQCNNIKEKALDFLIS